MTDTIVERLRAVADAIGPNEAKQIAYQAADEIARLRAENERLREALQRIARQTKTNELETELDVEMADWEDGFDFSVDLARAAINPDKESE